MKGIVLLAIGLMACAANPVSANERVTICAHYAANYGWSDGYKVEATVSSGTELNQATHSFSYSSIEKYVVIFWAADEASIIKLEGPYLGAFDVEGEDQQGRHWKVAKTDFCM